MKHDKSFVLAVLAVLLLAACTARPSAQPAPQPTQPPVPTQALTVPAGENQLADSTWKLLSSGPAGNETPALPGVDVTLTFDNQGQISGNAGCNSYGGSYVEKQGKLTVSQILHTLMACSDNAVMQQESAYLAALEKAASYQINAGQLVITTSDAARLTFARGG